MPSMPIPIASSSGEAAIYAKETIPIQTNANPQNPKKDAITHMPARNSCPIMPQLGDSLNMYTNNSNAGEANPRDDACHPIGRGGGGGARGK